MKKTRLFSCLYAVGISIFLSSCATMPDSGRLDARTNAALDAMTAKLSAAKTLRITSTRTASPGFYAGMPVAETASGTIVVRRPNDLASHLKTKSGNRAIGFNGKTLTLVDYKSNTHSVVKAEGDIDHAVRGIQKNYGINPPLAELLANDPRAVLLADVNKGSFLGTETIAGVECELFGFEQDLISWKLWVSTYDQLPRQISMTYPNGEGGDPLTMTATIMKWELDVPVSDSELRVTIPAGSQSIEMIPID